MKDQYFGDVNDYKKYGLLRLLSDHGRIKTAVCWMLTSADQRTDGKLTGYLRQPVKWRKYDPALFDQLLAPPHDPTRRNVAWAQITEIVPGATYYSRLLTDSAFERERYFQEFMAFAITSELSFFDPDNGLEVKSTPYGRRNSCKYVYWRELQQVWAAGQSLLVYQHFPRERRETFISNFVASAHEKLGVSDIITYRTGHVVFVLMSQVQHQAYFHQQSAGISQRWGEEVRVEYWARA